ncbi:jerky-like protein [Achlya hypogyna]|uniref:Jerky-like protein n=1 Tax=Achlya hypogyna TaxID=1202772 RepID=A0A1V9YC94_ACHHY|nr:jerky-like protein [Achlya hypogyna]
MVHTPAAISEALQMRAAKIGYAAIYAHTGVPKSTLVRYARNVAQGHEPCRKPGPVPRLPTAIDYDIACWVVGMQLAGYPVDRFEICIKAQTVCRHLDVTEVTARCPGHLVLATLADRRRHAPPFRDAYNMDESPFFSRSKSKNVVAVRGSKNVWTTESPTPAHLTYVACVSAAGHVQPSLFIMPGSRVTAEIAAAAYIEDCRVMTSESGFMNSTIFILWLDMFSSAIPATSPRLVVLFFDGQKSHISPEIIKRGAVLGILLVCLPLNATHLVQPLDVAVFGPLKKAVRATIRDFMVSSGSSNMSKAQAIKLACDGWKSGMHETNAISGFAATGL